MYDIMYVTVQWWEEIERQDYGDGSVLGSALSQSPRGAGLECANEWNSGGVEGKLHST